MKPSLLKIIIPILLAFSALKTLNSCSNREETTSCFPNQFISVQLNLSLPSYYPLNNIGGWIYVSEQQSGTRGLIVYRTNDGFKIYDRTTPSNLKLMKHLSGIDVTDVIALGDELAILVGADGFYQYQTTNPSAPVLLSKIEVK